MPDVPLVDVPHGRVTAVFPSPRTAVMIGHVAETVDSIWKDLFVEMSTGRRISANASGGSDQNLRREGSLPEIRLVIIIVDFQVDSFGHLVIFVVAGEYSQ
jgi:hypothetical protein